MKQTFLRFGSGLLAAALILGCLFLGAPQAFAADGILEASGHMETAYVKWADVSGAEGYNVYVKASSASTWTKLDNMLVREYPSYWRADALGLKAGSYVLKVVPVIGGSEKEASALTTDTLTVIAHDRSGYGFVNGTSSGAYNDDGTLKSSAVVIYVTNDNKDSVSATIGGTTYTGLTNILATSVFKTASVPICVRLIGNITDPTGGGKAFDKGDLLIDNNNNSVGLTIEGVGHDATCNGFGIRLKNSSNVEIRNLAVMNCDSNEGDNIGLQQNNDHIWVHNCDLFYGHAGGDADQAKGDGALDTKKSHYVTHSYNHFWDCGKCNLQGGSTSDTSDNITYHHNWYDHSDSRHPRVRVATVHVYNNYYDGVSKYGIGAAYKSEVISEGNYFRNTKNPMLISTKGSDEGVNTMSGETPGTLTSYKDYVVGATSWIPNVDGIQGATSWSSSSYDCTIIDTAYTAYSYKLQTAEEAKATVEAYAGRINHGDFIWRFNNSVDDTDYNVNTALKSALNNYKGSVISAGGVKITSGTGGNGSVSGGQTPGAHTCSYTATSTVAPTCTAEGYTVYTCSDCGDSYRGDTVAALGHNYVGGSCSRCGLVDASACAHSNETSVVTAPTCTEAGYTTYTCTACGTKRTGNTVAATGHTPGAAATCETAQTCTACGTELAAALGHNYVNDVCTRCGAEDLAASGYVHNFTESDKTSTFYTISGNTTTSRGDVIYNGMTLSKGFKMESSTSISFTAPADGTLTLVFGGSDTASSDQFKLDGTRTSVDSSFIYTGSISAGSHTITKGDVMTLYYMVYAPKVQEHTHSYTADTTPAGEFTPGKTVYTCACGHSYEESIRATVGNITVNKDGSEVTSAEVVIYEDTVNTSPVALLPDALPYLTDKAAAPVISLTVPSGVKLILDIPVKTPAWGNVAMLVNGNGTYTVIPETMRTETGIKVVIEESCKIIVVDNSKIFPDVPESHWAKKQVDYLSARGLMNGNLDGTFGQGDTIQRRTVAMMLWRLAGQPEPKGSSPFTDFTNSGDRYYKAVVWAYEQGIISGYTDGTFRPTAVISRQHFAAMLHRYNTYTGATLPAKDNGKLADFSDYADMNSRMYENMQWALDSSLIFGRSGGIYDPLGGTSRSQMAVILCRYLEAYYTATLLD